MTKHEVLIKYFEEHGHVRVLTTRAQKWISFVSTQGDGWSIKYHVSKEGWAVRVGRTVTHSIACTTEIWRKACHWWVGNQPSMSSVPHAWHRIFEEVNKHVKESDAWKKHNKKIK